MKLETLATQLDGVIGQCPSRSVCKVVRGRWTLFIDNEGWDIHFDDEFVDSEWFKEMIGFNGSNHAEVIESQFIRLAAMLNFVAWRGS